VIFVLEIICKVIFVLVAIVGIADIFRVLMFWLLRTKNEGKLYLVISIHGHEEETEFILSSAIERIKFMPGKDKRLICLDKGMDEETRKICGIIRSQNPEVDICTPEELPNILDQ
jgi:hypothetical protein